MSASSPSGLCPVASTRAAIPCPFSLVPFPFLYASRVRVPDVLVCLQLEPDWQAIGENPGRQFLCGEHAMHWGEQYRGRSRNEVMTRHDIACKFVVRSIPDHEL